MPRLQTARGKTLVIFPGTLGDFICFLPTLQELAEKGKVDLLARSEYADLVPENIVTRSLECYEISRLFMPGAEQNERLRNFFGSYASIYSWMASGQPDFVRHLNSLARRRPFIFPFRPFGIRMHVIDYYLSCVDKISKDEVVPFVLVSSGAVAWSEKFWQENGLSGKRVLVLAPGSGAKEKNWPADFYNLVTKWWEQSVGGSSVAILGPVEEEKLKAESIWGKALVAKGLKLSQLAALVGKSDLYLGNDSGVTHLAAALGVRTVALFGPTDLVQWGPRGKRVTVITRNVGCSPCADSVMKLCLHRTCLTGLTPAVIIRVLQETFGRAPCGQRPA